MAHRDGPGAAWARSADTRLVPAEARRHGEGRRDAEQRERREGEEQVPRGVGAHPQPLVERHRAGRRDDRDCRDRRAGDRGRHERGPGERGGDGGAPVERRAQRAEGDDGSARADAGEQREGGDDAGTQRELPEAPAGGERVERVRRGPGHR